MKICLVTSFPPSRDALNEYGFHIASELRQLPGIELCRGRKSGERLIAQVLVRAVAQNAPDLRFDEIGKSILALSIAANITRNGVPVLYFSLEDRLPKVVDRLFAGVSRVPIVKHTSQRINCQVAVETAEKLLGLPFEIRDDVYDLHKIIAVARRERAKHNTGLIVVDYAQLVRATGAETRREEVEKVSRELRLLAMELHVPLLLLCQLNKDGEARESKALEMDATAMWRVDKTSEVENGERRLAIPWQRNGESGIAATVAFLGSLARVENLSRETALTEADTID